MPQDHHGRIGAFPKLIATASRPAEGAATSSEAIEEDKEGANAVRNHTVPGASKEKQRREADIAEAKANYE